MQLYVYLCDPWKDASIADPVPPEGVSISGPHPIMRYAMDTPTALQALAIMIVGGVSVRLIGDWLSQYLQNHAAKRVRIDGHETESNSLELSNAIAKHAGASSNILYAASN